MFYPSEFVERIKRLYPDWYELHRRLETGDMWVERYLFDGAEYANLPQFIFKDKSPYEVMRKTNEAKKKKEILQEFYKLYHQQLEAKSLMRERCEYLEWYNVQLKTRWDKSVARLK